MGRIIGVYGAIGGVTVAIGMFVGITLVPHGGVTGMVVGYLTMLVAMSMVFMGVKQFRDVHQGGVIRFVPALWVGLAIAAVAAIFYVLAWELYMFFTNYSFMDEYLKSAVVKMQAEGKAAVEIAKFEREMAGFKEQYANPLFRMAITFTEIAPIGLLVSLISAALLRKSSFMPARATAS